MESYHDYVIKDGRFIGKFDEMYAKFPDPWMQSKQPNKYSRSAGIIHIQSFGIKSLLECGCGLGYYADWIHRETGIVPISVDIAKEAINKATKLFPHLHFEVADISTDLTKYKDLDCVMFAEIVWYILPKLNQVLHNLKQHFSGKYLLVNQVFYKGSQKYGVEYFTTPGQFIDFIPFQCVGRCEATLQTDTTIETSIIFRIT